MHFKIFLKVTFLMVLFLPQSHLVKNKQPPAAVTDIDEMKDFKKLLKTKLNVLVLFIIDPASSTNAVNVAKESAEIMKGQATVVIINCVNSESKKICKKFKVPADKPYYLKHYKNGEFHKDYDRSIAVPSMTNFLRDPTGDLPWEEDPTATDIHHLSSENALQKFLKKGGAGYKKSLIMFYAPWCTYCKIMKPEYVAAAAELKGHVTLAAIDVSKSENAKIRITYNITGFPTVLYFEKGTLRFPYNGDNKKDAIVAFAKEPDSQSIQKKEVKDESWSSDSDVVHLSSQNFDTTLSKVEHALVAFYAPWCGHCKNLKPEFEKAAKKIKSEKSNRIIAAVDVTKYSDLATKFGVKGYPTIKYFKFGEFQFDAGHARKEDQIINFIKDPQPPPPSPPPEAPWHEEVSAVRHLDTDTFKNALKRAKHAIVMFYAPWCGHCKSTKPEFVKAAEEFADELMVVFGAVDCTEQQQLCATHDVKAYPTLKYFSHFNKVVKDYTGGRTTKDFISFIHSQMDLYNTMQKVKTASAEGFGSNVQISSDADFMQIIGSSQHTIIMFYASWCSHCAGTKPIYSKLATAAKEKNLPLQVVAADAAENPKLADFAGIELLPTFKLYKSGKLVADYTGDRSFNDLVKFCKEHVKFKDEL